MALQDHMKSLNATFYIVLDGFDESETEPGLPLAGILSRLMLPPPEQHPLSIRVFLTGRVQGFASLHREMVHAPLEISLAPPEKNSDLAINQNDIILFAESKLNDISFFRGPLDPDVRDLKDRVKTTLAWGVRGDYFTLESKLGEISKARNVDKVEEILRRADEDRAQVVERQIKQLNESLTSDEIEEVNDILIWVNNAFRFLASVELLENALRLETRRNRLLGSFRARIMERYSDLFLLEDVEDVDGNIDDTFIVPRSDEIERFLLRTEQQTSIAGPDTTPRSKDNNLHEAEIAVMERIIKAHLVYTFGAGEDMWAKYQFDEFFEAKRGPTRAQIQYSQERADVVIARSCLVALCDKHDELGFTRLQAYGFIYFADHLVEQVNNFGLAYVNIAIKQEIGRKLVRLLREQTLIDFWLEQWLDQACEPWVFRPYRADAVLSWLRDPDLQLGLQDLPAEKQWVSSLTAKENTSSTRVLENVAIAATRRWVAADKADVTMAFYFLYGYFNQVSRSHLPSTRTR